MDILWSRESLTIFKEAAKVESLSRFFNLEDRLNDLVKDQCGHRMEFWNFLITEGQGSYRFENNGFLGRVWSLFEEYGVDKIRLIQELRKHTEAEDQRILCYGSFILEKAAFLLVSKQNIETFYLIQGYVNIKKGIYAILAKIELELAGNDQVSPAFSRPVVLDVHRFNKVMRELERCSVSPAQVIVCLQQKIPRKAGYSSDGVWLPLDPACTDREIFVATREILIAIAEQGRAGSCLAWVA